MSFCTNAIDAANNAVAAPMIATTIIACGAIWKIQLLRATIYTPAVTMVAAWIKALTGVGPSMASGSQTYKGICADFPVAPINNARVMAVAAGARMSLYFSKVAKLKI